MNSNKRVSLVSAEEKDKIDRKVLSWLNTFPGRPLSVDVIRYEWLPSDELGMALSTIQGSYMTGQDILGNYTAEYQFKVIYRLKPGNSIDKRLQADELLNRLGDWAVLNPPELGEGITVDRVETASRSSLFAVYDNGDEDHQILMRMTYSVAA